MDRGRSTPRIGLPRWRAPTAERTRYYAQSISRAGGEVILLDPALDAKAKRQVEGLQGLVLAGGTDVDPRLYGQRPHRQTLRPNRRRDRHEMALLEEALRRDIPVLAICRGHQLLNVFMGGRLIQHIADNSHCADPETDESAWHDVQALPTSRLATILGDGRLRVNSRHHQGVAADMVATGLRVTGLSPDGLVEGLEGANHRWLVGVQWHLERPEMAATMEPLFRAFVQATGAE